LLQQFFAYGVCGVVLLAGVYGSLWRRIRTLPPGAERVALTAFLMYVVIRGLAEAEPFDLLLPLWLIAALAFFLAQSAQGRPAMHADVAIAADLDVLPAR